MFPNSGNASLLDIARVLWLACYLHLNRTRLPSVARVYDIIGTNDTVRIARAGRPVPITAIATAVISERPQENLYDYVCCVLLDLVIGPLRDSRHPFVADLGAIARPDALVRSSEERSELILTILHEALNTLDRVHKGSLVVNDARLSSFGVCSSHSKQPRVCLTRFNDACLTERVDTMETDNLFRTKLTLNPADATRRLAELQTQHGARLLVERLNEIWTAVNAETGAGDVGAYYGIVSRVLRIFARVGISSTSAGIVYSDFAGPATPTVFWAPADFGATMMSLASDDYLPTNGDGKEYLLVFHGSDKRRILSCRNISNVRVDFAMLLLDITDVLVGGKGVAPVEQPWVSMSTDEKYRGAIITTLLKSAFLNWDLFW